LSNLLHRERMGQDSPSECTHSAQLERLKLRMLRLVVAVLAGLTLSAGTPLWAQTPITFRYFYDDAGQLRKVVDSTGVVIEYVYDAVGNILEIRRSTSPPGGLSVFNFTPGHGGPLTVVTIQGEGFAPVPSANLVKFNGVAAAVLSASGETLLVTVPFGATSGPISVTVGANTAVSATSFITSAIPVITSVVPSVIEVDRPPTNIQVTGVNLAGAAFEALPVVQPPALAIGTPTTNADGTAATLPITVRSSARGRFTLVASNPLGSSDGFPSARNTLWVFNANDSPDTDGDGFPDGLEALLGSDPLDADSIPTIRAEPEAAGHSVALRNGTAPLGPNITEADSLSFSLKNGTAPSPPSTLIEANSLTVALKNGTTLPPPESLLVEAASLTYAVANGVTPAPPSQVFEADSLTFSLYNSALAARGLEGSPPARNTDSQSVRVEAGTEDGRLVSTENLGTPSCDEGSSSASRAQRSDRTWYGRLLRLLTRGDFRRPSKISSEDGCTDDGLNGQVPIETIETARQQRKGERH
jgi:YD repeat-containing protein